MILTTTEAYLPPAFLRFTADPTPAGLTVRLRDGKPGEAGIVHTLHLTRSEGLALAAQLVPAALQAAYGSNLD